MIAFTLDTSGPVFLIRYFALVTGVFLAWQVSKRISGWNTITRAQRHAKRPYEQLAYEARRQETRHG